MIRSMSFSMMGDLPELMSSTFLASGSIPTTSCPSSARQPAETATTYPRPKTLIFMVALRCDDVFRMACACSRPCGDRASSCRPIGAAPENCVNVVHEVVAQPRHSHDAIGDEAHQGGSQKSIHSEVLKRPPRLADVLEEIGVADQVEAAGDARVALRRIGRPE